MAPKCPAWFFWAALFFWEGFADVFGMLFLVTLSYGYAGVCGGVGLALVRYFGFSFPAGNSQQNGASIPGHCEQHSFLAGNSQ